MLEKGTSKILSLAFKHLSICSAAAFGEALLHFRSKLAGFAKGFLISISALESQEV